MKNFIDKFFSLINFKSIWSKLFLAFVFLISLSCLIIGGFTLLVLHRQNWNVMGRASSELLNQVMDNMENRTESLMNLTWEFMVGDDVLDILAGSSQYKSYNEEQKKVRLLGNTQIGNSDAIDSVYVVSHITDKIYYYEPYSRNTTTMELASDVVSIVDEYLSENNLKTCWLQINGELYLGRAVISPKEIRNNLGTMAFKINPGFFDFVDKGDALINNNEIVFCMEEYHLYLSTGGNEREEIIRTYLHGNDQTSGSFTCQYTLNDVNYIISGKRHSQYYWDVFFVEDFSSYSETQRQIILIIVLVYLLVCTLATFIAYLISKGITRNIKLLSNSMRQLESGDFNIQIRLNGNDEVGQLCDSFNFMVNRINELIEKIAEERSNQEHLEYQLLKAQINPHFVFNSLGSVRSMANIRKEPEISEMVTALINILRISLGKEGKYLQVNEEIEYINNYFILQRYRWGDCFSVEYELSTDTLGCYIIGFVLQPLVENALFHGIQITNMDGVIRICSKRENDDLILSVEDNGVGMSMETIEQILSIESEWKKLRINSIGVQNINKRVKKCFGDYYGLEYESVIGKGTKAILRLPWIESEDELSNYVKG